LLLCVRQVRKKVSLMTGYCQQRPNKGLMEVPDPYYGGPDGFETVLDLLDDACSGLLEQIQVGQQQEQKA
jgi:protein-tyrosine phosphatase